MTCCSSETAAVERPKTATAAGKLVHMSYGGRELLAGFHITEVKRQRVESIDCGSRHDGWAETVIQLLDIDGQPEDRMSASKFHGILLKAGVALGKGPIIVEVGRPGEAMQLYDLADVIEEPERVRLDVNPRQAVCKPAFTMLDIQAASRCCSGQAAAGSSCCS